MADFRPQNSYFSRFSRCDFDTAFSTENVITPSKMPQLTWFLVYRLPIVPATKVFMGFWKFCIFAKLWPNLWAKMAFFCKKWHKLTKICPFDPQNGSYFGENAKYSKSHTYFCCRHYREAVYQKSGQLEHFWLSYYVFRRKSGTKIATRKT